MIAATIAHELGVDVAKVEATIRLLDEGNTVPFIARYRKEITDGLDDTQLRTLEERLHYLRELEDRKQTILASIEEQGKLTDELRALILECDSKARLEDLYLPFKKRRKTKADKAREAGIGAALEEIVDKPGADPEEIAARYVTEGYEDIKAVLDGARAILASDLSVNADLVGDLRDELAKEATAVVGVIEGKEAEGAKYQDYFEFSQPAKDMPSHRVLAILRGEKEGVLRMELDGGDDALYESMVFDHAGYPHSEWLDNAVHRAWKTKLEVSAALDVRMRMSEKAEKDALAIFAVNLRDVLLAAPAGQKSVLGLDPGYRNGVKCATVDATGKVLGTTIVYPHQPQNQWNKAVMELASIVAEHHVQLIAIGNGTASRETTKLAREVADMIGKAGGEKPVPVVVSESGASVYSASDLAAKEFPNMDVSLRGAVSIARRLQDPLAELVKIDPKSIGVGQYQHDVNQTELAHTLDAVVEDAVNSVGVDLNSASVPLLNRVAGITPTLAKNIVTYREEKGAFGTRKDLLAVPRLGPKAFEQCAGFLRIRGGDNPLDASAVHPEAYSVVEDIAKSSGVGVQELIGNTRVLHKLNPADFATETFGVPTVKDILDELDKPGRDPRPDFHTATFKEGVESVSDLTPGMILEGTVTNVAAFGAFVDVGVHQDGLVHVSAMSHSFVSDPHDVVKNGDTVKVKVLDVDVPRKRISLTLRLDDELGAGDKQRRGGADKRKTSQRDRRDAQDRRDGRGDRGRRGNRDQGSVGKRGARGNGGTGGSMADALRRAGFGK
ncbi:Tex family protein [Corynebacterium pyruviciproducens]|uniref:Tex family protein n=1 Tax=Corynebacterium pyruviciproducens TaxID=598660 RepID=UPI0024541AFD|nr:Tex family protein [Corynebacterium pyruviciproducens]